MHNGWQVIRGRTLPESLFPTYRGKHYYNVSYKPHIVQWQQMVACCSAARSIGGARVAQPCARNPDLVTIGTPRRRYSEPHERRDRGDRLGSGRGSATHREA